MGRVGQSQAEDESTAATGEQGEGAGRAGLLVGSSPWLLLVLAIGDWWLLRSGALRHPPWILAVLVAAAIVLLLAQLAGILRGVASGRRPRGAGLGRALLLAGLAVALAAGLANWLLSLQGFVVLLEGQAVPLHGGSHLQHFESGPLSRIEEMDIALALVSLELRSPEAEFFYPESLLEVKARGGEPRRVAVHPRKSASAGSLRFYQGAFGFAPRIVVLRAGETLFDQVVPFTSERHGERGISFEGRFELAEENLQVEGAVDLGSLDEGLQGHATLRLTVRRGGELLGRGSLLPGHFAEIEQGYRIGFAGLEKWSEIDVSRRHYGQFVLAGAALALVGGVLWPLAAWRRW